VEAEAAADEMLARPLETASLALDAALSRLPAVEDPVAAACELVGVKVPVQAATVGRLVTPTGWQIELANLITSAQHGDD
jgi:hypothetical protein